MSARKIHTRMLYRTALADYRANPDSSRDAELWEAVVTAREAAYDAGWTRTEIYSW